MIISAAVVGGGGLVHDDDDDDDDDDDTPRLPPIVTPSPTARARLVTRRQSCAWGWSLALLPKGPRRVA